MFKLHQISKKNKCAANNIPELIQLVNVITSCIRYLILSNQILILRLRTSKHNLQNMQKLWECVKTCIGFLVFFFLDRFLLWWIGSGHCRQKQRRQLFKMLQTSVIWLKPFAVSKRSSWSNRCWISQFGVRRASLCHFCVMSNWNNAQRRPCFDNLCCYCSFFLSFLEDGIVNPK